MKIIRSERQKGDEPDLEIIPLLVSWELEVCGIENCTNKTTTIISQLEGAPVFGLCECHYQTFSQEQESKFTLKQ